MMMKIEDNRTTELQMRVWLANPGTYISMTPQEATMQENLRADTKALVTEYLQHVGSPLLKPDSWKKATVEIISTATLDHIKTLEELLQEIANETDSVELAERIQGIIQC